MSDTEGFPVQLRLVDCDHLLAAAEWMLSDHEDDAGELLGPGLHGRGLEEAARRIEAAADMERRGIRP